VSGPVRSIPLFDATAPIACTLGADEVRERTELLERLRRDLDAITTTEHGLLLRFPDRPAVEADVRRFAADEKRCCTFWGFAVEAGDGAVTLRWDAPPGAAELLARIEAHLRGDEPLASVTDLL
jgi:hypothetical protein